MRPLAGALGLATALLVVAGCQSGSTPTASRPTPLPEPALNPVVGSDCRSQIGRFREIIDYDASVGRLEKGQYGRATQDLAQASSACEAGRDVQARTILTQTKRNYGYP